MPAAHYTQTDPKNPNGAGASAIIRPRMPGIPQAEESVDAHYAAAHRGCLIVEHPSPGVIVARGKSVLDFLQRMSTNDLAGIEPGQSRGTVLTNAIGRIVDVIRVWHRSTDFWLVTSPGRAAEVRSWLARYIFFQDDVALEEVDGAHRLWGLYGPEAEATLESLKLSNPAGTGSKFPGDPSSWRSDFPPEGFLVLAGTGLAAQSLVAWGERGPGSNAGRAYDALRVENGVPAAGYEINDEVIPLEVNLWPLVNFKKGCYIGQEVIARMESRNQIARTLIGVRMDQPVKAPQQIEVDGRLAGQLTSSANSPRLGPVGLALVRTGATGVDGQPILLAPSGVSARLEPLPLSPSIA